MEDAEMNERQFLDLVLEPACLAHGNTDSEQNRENVRWVWL